VLTYSTNTQKVFYPPPTAKCPYTLYDGDYRAAHFKFYHYSTSVMSSLFDHDQLVVTDALLDHLVGGAQHGRLEHLVALQAGQAAEQCRWKIPHDCKIHNYVKHLTNLQWPWRCVSGPVFCSGARPSPGPRWTSWGTGRRCRPWWRWRWRRSGGSSRCGAWWFRPPLKFFMLNPWQKIACFYTLFTNAV